jgi:TrmH family RNA methyltransferase
LGFDLIILWYVGFTQVIEAEITWQGQSAVAVRDTVSGVITVLSPDCADLFSQKVINASMGSFARVATHTADLAAALATVPAATPVLGCDLTGDDVHTLPPLRDAVIVIGSEGRGLSAAVAARITRRITIPRYGAAESLNAATAAAIVCDNLRRIAPPM